MGDEDGARQILEEVAAEGSDELQAEARALLDRIG
jgi:pilus assembly protein FimV